MEGLPNSSIDAQIKQAKENWPQLKIEDANDFTELFSILGKISGLQGSQEFLPSEYLIKSINELREGNRSITAITRTAGLRDIVARLLEQEKASRN